MAKNPTPNLQQVLATPFRFEVIPDEVSGYVIKYPDLPGCMTQIESLDELPVAAREIRALWLETEYEANLPRLLEILKIPA